MVMPTGEICKRSFHLFKNNILLFLKYVLLSLLPPVLLLLFGGSALFITLLNSVSMDQMGMILLGIFVILLLVIVYFYLVLWFAIALNVVIYEKVQNKAVGSMKETLKKARPFIWRTTGSSFMASLVAMWPLFVAFVAFPVLQLITMKSGAPLGSLGTPVMILLSALGVYGLVHLVWFGVRLYFSYFGVLFESKKVMDSLRFSKTLVKNRWWAVFGRLLCLTLILLVSLMVFGGVFSFLEQINAVFGRLVEWFLGSILGVVFTIMTTYLFVSLKNTMITEITSAPNPPQQNK